VNVGLLFREQTFYTRDILRTLFVGAQQNLAALGPDLANGNLFPEFRELWSLRGPVSVIPCGNIHQSFTDALVKWFFDNIPEILDLFLFTALPED